MEQTLSRNERLLGCRPYGFDCEYKALPVPGRTALVQLSNVTKILLIQVSAFSGLSVHNGLLHHTYFHDRFPGETQSSSSLTAAHAAKLTHTLGPS